MPDEPTKPETGDDIRSLLKAAVERANALQGLFQREDVPVDRTTLLAVTIVAATSAQQFGLSINDAFALYLSVFESVDVSEHERLNHMLKYMKNSIADLVERGLLPGVPPDKPTQH